MSRSDWSGRSDPDGNIQQFVTTGAGLNDSKVQQSGGRQTLARRARQSQDNAVRKQKYDAAAAILNEDLPIIFIGHQAWIWGYNKRCPASCPRPMA